MRKLVVAVAMASMLSSARAECGAPSPRPLDVAITCVPSSKKLVYRCNARVIHTETGAPICIHEGTITFDMPSMPMAHQVPKIQLRTDANGEMKELEVQLEMLGEWRAIFDVGGTTIAKRMNFQAKAVVAR